MMGVHNLLMIPYWLLQTGWALRFGTFRFPWFKKSSKKIAHDSFKCEMVGKPPETGPNLFEWLNLSDSIKFKGSQNRRLTNKSSFLQIPTNRSFLGKPLKSSFPCFPWRLNVVKFPQTPLNIQRFKQETKPHFQNFIIESGRLKVQSS